MNIDVYRGLEKTIELNLEQAVYTHGKMEVRELVFSVETTKALDIEIGDSITYRGERMSVNYTPTYVNAGKNRRQYTIVFEGQEAEWMDSPLTHNGDVEFSYFGTAADLLGLIVNQVNVYSPGWVVEEVDDVEPEHFEFSDVDCLHALNVVAEKFELEWRIDKKKVKLVKNIGVVRNVTLSQGRGNGLYSLTREYLKDTKIFTRGYALGGTENIPEGGRLRLEGYVDRNTHLYGIKRKYYTFDKVYPSRTGTATAVARLSDKAWTLSDASLDFDINGQRAGENDVSIVFKSGALNGQQFVITRYDHATRTITYKAKEDKSGALIPFSVTKAAVGDKYTLVGLIMPDTYKPAALNELSIKLNEAIERDSVPKVVYGLDADVLFLKQNGFVFEPGDIVRAQDADIDLDELLCIQRVSYPAIFPHRLVTGMKFTADVGNTAYSRITDKLYEDSQKQIVVNGELRKQNAELARTNALRLRELQNYIFDADDYFDTDRIKPASIETQMLSVGAKSQNFFLSGVTMQANYNGNANSFFVSGGQLQHREITIAQGFIWTLNQQSFSGLDPFKTYYLSAKCNKTQLAGTYNLSQTPYKVEDQAGFYNFNIGVLYPVADGKRFFANTAGVTYIVGSQITTGRVKSMDGQTWFDLDTGEIRGNLKLTSGESVQSAWKKDIDAIHIGGTNLLLKSNIDSRGWGYTSNHKIYSLSERINQGEEVTVAININYSGSSTFRVRTQTIDGNTNQTNIPNSDLKKVSNGLYEGTFVWTNSLIDAIHILKENPSIGETWDLNWIKLEKGNKATDWSPAPEDVEESYKEYTSAQINIAKDNINLSVESKIDSIQVGGRNLVLGTNSTPYEVTWIGWTGYPLSSGENGYRLAIKPNVFYTYSLFFNTVSSPVPVTVRFFWYDSAGNRIEGFNGDTSVANGGSGVCYVTQRAPATAISAQLVLRKSENNSGISTVTIKEIKVEEGNKPTGWAPAPEDVQSSVTNLAIKIDANTESITSKAERTEVNALGNRVSTAEAKITPDAINLTVSSQIDTKVGNVEVGGRNILEESNIPVQNTSYIIKVFPLIEKPIVGDEYTCTLWGRLAPTKTSFYIYNSGGNVRLANLIVIDAPSTENGNIGKYQATFLWRNTSGSNTARDTALYVYAFTIEQSGTSRIERIKLEKGNKGTEYTPPFEEYSTTEATKSSFNMTNNNISLLGQTINLTGLITFQGTNAQNAANAAQGTANTANTKATNAQSAADAANTAALDAAGIANGKGKVIYAASAPTSTSDRNANNLWIRTSDNKPHRWTGSAWSAVTDKVATDAAAAANTANSNLAALQGSLKSMAYEDRVNLAKLDNSIVEGGYFKTTLIDVQDVFAQTVTATNLTVSGSSKIGQMSIDSNGYLYNNSVKGGMDINGNNISARIGTSTAPGTLGLAIPMWIENHKTDQDTNYGIVVSAKNAYGGKNYALTILEGGIRVKGEDGLNANISIQRGATQFYTHLKFKEGVLVKYQITASPNPPTDF